MMTVPLLQDLRAAGDVPEAMADPRAAGFLELSDYGV